METSVDTLIRTVQYRAEHVNEAPKLVPLELVEKEPKSQIRQGANLAKSQ
jgi:hypothetical protein